MFEGDKSSMGVKRRTVACDVWASLVVNEASRGQCGAGLLPA